MIEPWDRQEEEPAKAYERFLIYRDLGPARTLQAAYNMGNALESAGKRRFPEPNGTWRGLFEKWRWKERAEAWDDHTRPQRRAARLKALEEAQQRHLEIARLQVEKALAFFRELDPRQLSPDQALRLLESGIKLERDSIEEPAIADLQDQINELIKRLEGGT